MTRADLHVANVAYRVFRANGVTEETALAAAWLSATCDDADLWLRMLTCLRRR